MLAAFAFVLFVIAGILHLIGRNGDIQTWLVIIGGALVSANCAWGWAGPRFRRGPAE